MTIGTLTDFFTQNLRNPKHSTIQRWCIQILTAISYLHSCHPPIVHANLSCDTILRHHNGQLKVGSIALDIIRTHVNKRRVSGNQITDTNRDLHSPEVPQDIHQQAASIVQTSNQQSNNNKNNQNLNSNNLSNHTSDLTTVQDQQEFHTAPNTPTVVD